MDKPVQEEVPKNYSGLKFLLRALKYRNYRLFFFGQGVSLIGTWMQGIAISWLVYRVTNSAFLLSLTSFAVQIPTFLLAPIAGVLADRMNRKKILMVTQVCSMVQAIILAALFFTGWMVPTHIIILSIMLGLINAIDAPVRQTFVIDMVDKEDLQNAIALNSSMFNGARLIGPSIAGIIIAFWGEGVCFLINAASFMAIIFALNAMKFKANKVISNPSPILHQLREGFGYVIKHTKIKRILLLVTLISLTGASYAVLMPIFAKDILKGGPQTLGFLMGFAGAGALIGALYLAGRKNLFGLEKNIFSASIIFGLGLIGFACSRTLWLSLVLIFCAGFGMMVQIAAANTLLQHLTSDDKRGRVMSIYTVCLMGVAPLGIILTGFLATHIGAVYTLLVNGCVGLIGSIFLAQKLSYGEDIF